MDPKKSVCKKCKKCKSIFIAKIKREKARNMQTNLQNPQEIYNKFATITFVLRFPAFCYILRILNFNDKNGFAFLCICPAFSCIFCILIFAIKMDLHFCIFCILLFATKMNLHFACILIFGGPFFSCICFVCFLHLYLLLCFPERGTARLHKLRVPLSLHVPVASFFLSVLR